MPHVQENAQEQYSTVQTHDSQCRLFLSGALQSLFPFTFHLSSLSSSPLFVPTVRRDTTQAATPGRPKQRAAVRSSSHGAGRSAGASELILAQSWMERRRASGAPERRHGRPCAEPGRVTARLASPGQHRSRGSARPVPPLLFPRRPRPHLLLLLLLLAPLPFLLWHVWVPPPETRNS